MADTVVNRVYVYGKLVLFRKRNWNKKGRSKQNWFGHSLRQSDSIIDQLTKCYNGNHTDKETENDQGTTGKDMEK